MRFTAMTRSRVSHGKWSFPQLAAAFLAFCLVLALTLRTAHAEEGLPDAAINEIHDVISAQLDAFKRDDAQAAFSYASPDIQEQVGSPENFLNLVREQYRPVYRSKSAEFQPIVALSESEGIVQPVVVTGPDNIPVLAMYMVEQQSDGSWRISGCLLYSMGSKGIEA